MKQYSFSPFSRLIGFWCLALAGLLPAQSWAQVLPAACASPVPAPLNPHGNLIYNGSFEEGDTSVVPLGLPTDIAGVCNRLDTGQMRTRAELAGWSSASKGTPDWFKQGSVFAASIPYNQFNQNILLYAPAQRPPALPAHSGNGYGGLLVCNDIPGVLTWEYREYLQQKLVAPLSAAQDYYTEFYSLLAYNSDHTVGRLGVATYLNDPYQGFTNYLQAIPSGTIPGTSLPIVNQHDANFNSTGFASAWSRTAGAFRADGGEQYLVIGNFDNRANTTYQLSGTATPGGGTYNGYQYIDDVLLQPFPDPLLTYDLATNQLRADVIGALPASSGAEYEWEWDEPCPAPCTPQHHTVRSTDPAFLPPTPYAAGYTLTVHVPYPDGSGYYRGTTHRVLTPVLTGLAHATPEAAITIYPTPTPDGRFTLEAPAGATGILTDATGREVWRTSHLGPLTSNLKLPSPGLYLLRLTWPDGRTVTRKVVR